MPQPVLQAMVLADHVYQDRTTGKFIIAGTFSTILFAPNPILPVGAAESAPTEIVGERKTHAMVPVAAGSPYLYVALTDVHGSIPLRLRYVRLDDSTVLLEGHIEITASDPIGIAEYCFPMPPLPIMLGSFSLDLLHDGEILGSWRVLVRDGIISPGE